MKKFVIGFLLLAALVAGALLLLGSRLDGIVADLIEEHGSAATGTPVRVQGVGIRLNEASGNLSGLTVGNPDGFSGNAIEMDDFRVTLDPASLASDAIVIPTVDVRGARIALTQLAERNNLNELRRNLSRLGSSDAESVDDDTRLIIDRFVLEDATVSVDLPDFEERREIALPRIVVTDIGRRSNGATGAEVAKQVLEPIIDRTLTTALRQSVRDRVTDAIGEATDGVLDGIFGSDEDDEVPE